MKKLILGAFVLLSSCNPLNNKEKKLEQAKTLEMVLWKFKEGVSIEEGKALAIKLNEFVKMQPGFVARKTATTPDGEFLDIIYWTSVELAKQASEKAMQNPMTTKIFQLMDEREMIFKYFEIFNTLD